MKPLDLTEEWSPAMAEALAVAEGITLGDEHWRVITCWRELAARRGRIVWLADLSDCGVSVSKVNELFPGNPREILSRLAGVPD